MNMYNFGGLKMYKIVHIFFIRDIIQLDITEVELCEQTLTYI